MKTVRIVIEDAGVADSLSKIPKVLRGKVVTSALKKCFEQDEGFRKLLEIMGEVHVERKGDDEFRKKMLAGFMD